VIASALSIALLAGTGFVIHSDQARSRAEILSRFNLRAEIGAQFLQSYVTELTQREAEAASGKLAGVAVSQRAFVDMTTTLGFQAALLTGRSGHVLRVYPNNRSLIGTDLGAKYEPLRQAMRGAVVVSGVQPTGAAMGPVVGMIAPFPSIQGRRIYVGVLALSKASVVSSYLRTISTVRGVSVWLVDGAGQTIASNSPRPQSVDLLKREDPALFAGLTTPDGDYEGRTGPADFAVADVAGTPWRLVVAAPEAQIFIAVGGLGSVVPWLVFAGLVLAAGAVALLQMKLSKARAKQLDHVGLLSLTDAMTGIYNRRGYEVLASQLLKDAAREGRCAALIFLDVNDLKTINDTLGHAVGDDAIIAAARLLRTTFRDADVIARLGGDEFCVIGVLPGPPMDGSSQLLRLHNAVGLYNAREGAPFHLSLSGGLSIWDPSAPRPLKDLEIEADRRMYADKQSKRLKAM
jgi:diguanylate cyclase (GGDEF)-like protein